jgi:hypothetical protein
MTSDPDDFHLDILGQQPRINSLCTQITLCFPLADESSNTQSEIINTLTGGLERLSANFPWVAGKVVYEHGSFRIKPPETTGHPIAKYLRQDCSAPNWDALRQANFPFSMLDESIIAPGKTLSVLDATISELPVFLVQLNFITGGLLLTFNGQHGSMDMTGQGRVMYLLAKACRHEPFTPSELSVGNMDRKNIIPLLDDAAPEPKSDHQSPEAKDQTAHPQAQSPPPKCTWAYFIFSADSLSALKTLATKTVPPGSFASTDDVLSAFTWQSITRARLPRLVNPSRLRSTLSRNVDVRRYFPIPSTYPGLATSSTTHTSAMEALAKEPLGAIAAQLRAALDPESLRHSTRSLATRLSRKTRGFVGFAGTSVPSLDVRLSSWAKESCYDLDFGLGFGIGKPEAVRRPRFAEGAREGLVYFLPKRLDMEIAVGVCLRDEDLARLKDDWGFAEFGTYVG